MVNQRGRETLFFRIPRYLFFFPQDKYPYLDKPGITLINDIKETFAPDYLWKGGG